MIRISILIRELVAAYREARAIRSAARELSALGPEILADIGIPEHCRHRIAAELALGRERPAATPAPGRVIAFPAPACRTADAPPSCCAA